LPQRGKLVFRRLAVIVFLPDRGRQRRLKLLRADRRAIDYYGNIRGAVCIRAGGAPARRCKEPRRSGDAG
jgi:hypothetical protein